MFKQREAGSTPSGLQSEDQVTVKPLSLQLPDVHESMRLAGVEDVRLDQSPAPGPRSKERRVLCCCRQPGCGIGPMTYVEEQR